MSNAQVNLNIDEVKGFLTHIMNNNRFLQSGGKPPVAVEIVGESGIGKTSSVLQLANETGMNVVKLNLAQIEDYIVALMAKMAAATSLTIHVGDFSAPGILETPSHYLYW